MQIRVQFFEPMIDAERAEIEAIEPTPIVCFVRREIDNGVPGDVYYTITCDSEEAQVAVENVIVGWEDTGVAWMDGSWSYA